MLLATALSALAFGALPVGAPVDADLFHSDPRFGLGAPVADSTRMLAVAVPDPSDGGPPWGLRYVKTTRGVGCVQLGRVQDGQLGALGRDHAFADDGAFHPIPTAMTDVLAACAPLDTHGTLFAGTAATGIAAAAMPGGSCEVRRFVRGVPESALCPDADVRNVYFGALGPQARSVTYTLADGPHTVPTVGPEGAYLIVLPDTASKDFNGVMSGVVPLNTPITELTFTDGTRCAVTERGAKGRCAIPGREFAPLRRVRAGGARAKVRTRVLQTGRRDRKVIISFRARVATHGMLESYDVTLRPDTPHARGLVTPGGGQDVAAGHVARIVLAPVARGRYTGTVTLVRESPDETARPRVLRDRVGSFVVTVP